MQRRRLSLPAGATMAKLYAAEVFPFVGATGRGKKQNNGTGERGEMKKLIAALRKQRCTLEGISPPRCYRDVTVKKARTVITRRGAARITHRGYGSR